MNDGAAGKVERTEIEEIAIGRRDGRSQGCEDVGPGLIGGGRGVVGEEFRGGALSQHTVEIGKIGLAQRVGVGPGPEPHHMGDGQIGEGEPQDDKQQHGGKSHALGQRADDERRRDAGEGHLEHDIDELRDEGLLGEGRDHGVRVDTGQHRLGQAADERGERRRTIGGKGKRVAIDHPQDRDDAEADEDLHEDREHVLARTSPP